MYLYIYTSHKDSSEGQLLSHPPPSPAPPSPCRAPWVWRPHGFAQPGTHLLLQQRMRCISVRPTSPGFEPRTQGCCVAGAHAVWGCPDPHTLVIRTLRAAWQSATARTSRRAMKPPNVKPTKPLRAVSKPPNFVTKPSSSKPPDSFACCLVWYI